MKIKKLYPQFFLCALITSVIFTPAYTEAFANTEIEIDQDTDVEKEEQEAEKGFFSTQKLEYPGQYNAFFGIKTLAYGGFISIKGMGKSEEDWDNFKFLLHGFGLQLSPLVQDKSHPDSFISLDFFLGSLIFKKALPRITRPCFSKLKPLYRGFPFPEKKLALFNKNGSKIDSAIQFGISNFSFSFLRVSKPTTVHFDYGLYSDWKKTDFTNKNYKLGVTTFLGFSPKKEAQSLYSAQKPSYYGIIAGEFIFSHPFFGIQILGEGTHLSQEKNQGAFRAETYFLYKYIGCTIGGSSATRNFIGWKNISQKEKKSFFIQPKIIRGPIECFGLYALYIDETKETPKSFEYGNGLRIKYKNFSWTTQYLYSDEIYTLESALKIAASQNHGPLPRGPLRGFHSFCFETRLDLQERGINPFIVKKYIFTAQGVVHIHERHFFGFKTAFLQYNSLKRKKNAAPILEWQPFSYNAELFYTLKYQIVEKKHQGTIKLWSQTKAPRIGFSLIYKIF